MKSWTFVALAASTLLSWASAASVAAPWGQCGGDSDSVCPEGFFCNTVNSCPCSPLRCVCGCPGTDGGPQITRSVSRKAERHRPSTIPQGTSFSGDKPDSRR